MINQNPPRPLKPSTLVIGGAILIGSLCIGCSIAFSVITTLSRPQIPTSTPFLSPTVTPTLSLTPSTTHTPTVTFTPSITPTFTITFTPTTTFTPTATLSTTVETCVPRTTQRDVGTVMAVIDGDTIDVEINGQEFRIRYIGIDTPEKGETFAMQATSANQALVNGKKVLLVKDVSETDEYGRLLRYVFVGDIFVNHELVKQGYALAATFPPDVSCSELFANAQNQAQSESVGLWRPTPEPTSGGGSNCHPSYPTVCIPPPPPDLDCKDIPYRRFKVLPPDPHRFDGDGDGIGCESN